MNKQIEKLSEELLFYTLIHDDDLCDEVAEYIITAGYRKKEDVAREIFTKLEAEIEPALKSNYILYEKYLNEEDSPTLLRVGGKIDALRGIYCFIEDLKKKYGVKEDESEG